MTSQVATRYARWTVVGILALFVVDLAVPRVAKPWTVVGLAVAVVVLLLTLGACWVQPTTSNRAALLAPGLFAVGLLASIIYLRSLPEAAIPLVGVGALLVSVVGLASTGLRLRSH